MSIKCDVLVIGGGPAGSSAAHAASKNGANTILIEKKKELKEISCAEGIGSYLFPLLPFRIPKEQLIWRIDGILFSDGKIKITRKGHFYRAWSIERKKFDKWLLKKATEAGTKTMMGTELTNIETTEDNKIKKVTAKTSKKDIILKPEIVIAADGTESTVGRKLGFVKKIPNAIGNVYSWEMTNLSIKNPHLEQMYFGDFAPGGYAYLFPKSENTANIGVGSSKDTNLEKNFKYFTEKVIYSQLKNAVKTIDRSGKAPIDNIIPNCRYGNILFTGDAANQNFKPYIEGILPSVICGDIAGKVASFKDSDKYESYIMKKLGKQFKGSDKLLQKIHYVDKFEGEKKNLLNLHLFGFADERVDELANKSIEDIKKELFRKSSSVNSFITMLGYFIWYTKVLATRRD